MSDTPQQQQQTYPGDFAVTGDGLAMLHQRLGRLIHQAIEADLRWQKTEDAVTKLQAHYAEHYVLKAPDAAAEDAEPTPLARRKGG